MTDKQLAEGLGLTKQEAAYLIPRLPPKVRERYEYMIEVADQVRRGERPPGVIVCGEHR